MAVLDDMDAKLDQLISLASEELNIHPDILMPGMVHYVVLPLTSNAAVKMEAEFSIQDRENGRYLVMRLRDPQGYWIFSRAWRCVWRPYPGEPGAVVDRPGQTPNV